MLHHGIALYDLEGVIRWHWLSAPIGSRDYNGMQPWNLLDAAERERLKGDIGVALMDGDCGPRSYRLDREVFGESLTAQVRLFRIPCSDKPLLAFFYIVPAVIGALSDRERQVAQLLPLYTNKEIAKQLQISASTVETVKQRLALKVGLSGHALVGWCTEHREII